jgi:hypothetical protein
VKVSGEVDVGAVRLDGTVSVSGPITVDSLRSRGTLEADGSMTVLGIFDSDGNLHAGGPVRAAQASLVGTTRVGADVTVAGSLLVRGQFAAASVHAGEFRGDGAIAVPGTTEAVDVDMRIRRDSAFGTIHARTVRLIRSGPNPIERLFGRSPATPVARIEADRVELEGVDVAFVHCPEVILGRDAHVTELEGTVVRRHATASVGPRSLTPPPYGLRR